MEVGPSNIQPDGQLKWSGQTIIIATMCTLERSQRPYTPSAPSVLLESVEIVNMESIREMRLPVDGRHIVEWCSITPANPYIVIIMRLFILSITSQSVHQNLQF